MVPEGLDSKTAILITESGVKICDKVLHLQ